MAATSPRLPEQFRSGEGDEDNFTVSELVSEAAGAHSPFGETEFPLPVSQLTYVHPRPAGPSAPRRRALTAGPWWHRPIRPSDGSPSSRRASTLAQWLRGRSDRELATLLTLRPDLALPAPADVAALAARLAVRTSVQRAVDGLDAYALRALENLVVAADADAAVPARPGGRTRRAARPGAGVGRRVARPPRAGRPRGASASTPPGSAGRRRCCFPRCRTPCWRRCCAISTSRRPRSPGAAPRRRRCCATRSGSPSSSPRSTTRSGRCCAGWPAGPPVGSVRATRLAPDAAAASAPHRLMSRGLLIPLDGQRIELPREVGVAVRGSTAGPEATHRPSWR